MDTPILLKQDDVHEGR